MNPLDVTRGPVFVLGIDNTLVDYDRVAALSGQLCLGKICVV